MKSEMLNKRRNQKRNSQVDCNVGNNPIDRNAIRHSQNDNYNSDMLA